MSLQAWSIVALVAVFLIATVLPLNMGALALAAAFFVGALGMGLTAKQIFAGFPGDLFVTLVGVTWLFAIAQKNGTVDWLVERAVALVRGHTAAIPWVMFAVAALLTGFGALGPAAVAILAPVALRFAVQHRMSPAMLGLMVIHGAQAGGFSPISVYGGIVNRIVAEAGLPEGELTLFLASLLFNLAIAVVVFVVFGGWRSLRGGPGAAANDGDAAPAVASLTWIRGVTLAGLVALGVGVLVFDLNVGLAAIVVACALALLSPGLQKGSIDKVSWSTVLLICGVITYVEVMQTAGTVTQVGAAISGLGSPLLAALLLCFVGAIVSAFASSTALLGAVIPLAVPFLLRGEVSATAVVAAIAVCTTIVDTSPFSTNGALVVANAAESQRERVLRQLLIYSAIIALSGPLVAWLALVVPGWL
jgi:di/tricarboxylate transporter